MTTDRNEAGNLLPQAFTFNASNQQVRTVILDGQPYFVVKDVCDVLGHTNPSVAIQMLDDDERAKKSLGRQGEMWLVNESGLYNLIFRSNKPEAKSFRKWVTSEVLPTLRRTGRYELPSVRKRESIRYPRRGEQITADILHLLWLIGESLHQGDQIAVALELGGIASDRKPRSERRTEEQQNPDGSLQAGTGQPGSGSSVLLSARDGATAHERICDATRAAAASCGAFQPR